SEGGEVTPGSGPTVFGLAGHLLFCELATPVGRVADEARARRQPGGDRAAEPAPEATTMPPPGGKPAPTAFSSFGMHRIVWPRHALLHEVGRRLCKRLVERWMTKDAK